MTTSPIHGLHIASRIEGVQSDGCILIATSAGMVYLSQEIVAAAAVRSARETSPKMLADANERYVKEDAENTEAMMRRAEESQKAARHQHPSSAPKLTVIEGGA